MARKAFTFESNLDKIITKIQDKPNKVMGTVAGSLVREIRATTLKEEFKQRYKILSKSTRTTGLQWAYGYDEAKKQKIKTVIQIGFKHSIPGLIGGIISGKEKDPIKPVVIKNIDNIQKSIAEAINEINKE